MVGIAFAQNRASTAGFQWSWRKSQELHWKQSLSRLKRINLRDRNALTGILLSKFEHCADPKKCAASTRIKMVDLNGDGVPEVIAQASDKASCGTTGNCMFWIFQKTAKGYKLILERDGIQTFTIQPTRTQGFSDLVLGMHGSAFLHELFIYRFRDGDYRVTACYDANWSYLDKNGEANDLKEPRIAPCTHDWQS
jgi:hypothetical protein